MRSVSEHAAWWNAEMALFWPQAGMVLGDRLAHEIVKLGTSGDTDTSIFFLGHPFIRRDPNAVFVDVSKPPLVAERDGGLLIEIPEGVDYAPLHVLDRMHNIIIRGLVLPGPWLPAELRLSVGLDANPSVDSAGEDLLVQAEVRLDIPDFVRWLTGLWVIEQELNNALRPWEIALNGILESYLLIGVHLAPGFRQMRYDRLELSPTGVEPSLLQSRATVWRRTPVSGGRLDWWDVVFVADGFDSSSIGRFDEFVGRATHMLTGRWPAGIRARPAALPGDPGVPADPGAVPFAAYGSVVRTWVVKLGHATPQISVRESFNDSSQFANLSTMAEVGLLMDATLAREYEGTPPVPHRTTYVVVRGVPAGDTNTHRATSFGNFVLMPLSQDPAATTLDAMTRTTVLLHELGHLRHSKLADEYAGDGGGTAYQGPEPRQINISRSSSPTKWSRFGAAAPGAEGAYEFAHRIYKPTTSCRMDTGSSAVAFCPVCTDAIVTGLLRHLGDDPGDPPPLALQTRFSWPFTGTWHSWLAARIGPDAVPAELPLPYLNLTWRGGRIPVVADVSVERAAVPAPWDPPSRHVVASPGDRLRFEVLGTHPHPVGFESGISPRQAADLLFSRGLTLEQFGITGARATRQARGEIEIEVGADVQQTLDLETGDLLVDISLGATGTPSRRHEDLRLATDTAFVVVRQEPRRRPLREETIGATAAYHDPDASLPRTHPIRQLRPGQYEWRVRTQVSPSSSTIGVPPILSSDELDRPPDGFHFRVVAPLSVAAPPLRPVALAAGAVQLSFVTDRDGRALPPAPQEGRRALGDLGLALATTKLIDAFKDRDVTRLRLGRPQDYVAGAGGVDTRGAQASLEELARRRGGLPGGPGGEGGPAGGPTPPSPGLGLPPDYSEIPREPEPEIGHVVVVRGDIVMIVWSLSPAGEALSFEFQRTGSGGSWIDIPYSEITFALSEGLRFIPVDAGLSRRIEGFGYTSGRDVGSESRWRARAVDESGRTSDWSSPAPLLNFNAHLIPARLGRPLRAG
jgi:hypothetical protein